MKKTGLTAITFLLSFIFLNIQTASAQGWRCGNLLIDSGVQSYLVMQYCGEPLSKDIVGCTGQDIYSRVSFVIEKWVYGPEAGYYYFLYFRGGLLDRIEAVRQP